jgi:hypothetical protein
MKLLLIALLAVVNTSLAADPVRDPMRPPSAAGAIPGQRPNLVPITVSAIFISPTRRTAIVDGQLVKAGESAGLCQVLEILDEGVRCRFPKGTRIVRLPGTGTSFKKSVVPAVAANGVP